MFVLVRFTYLRLHVRNTFYINNSVSCIVCLFVFSIQLEIPLLQTAKQKMLVLARLIFQDPGIVFISVLFAHSAM